MRIAVGFDGHEHSHAALRWAHAAAVLTGGSLQVLDIWTLTRSASHHSDVGKGRRELEERTRAVLTDLACPVTFEVVVSRNRPGQALADATQEADLIVIGHRQIDTLHSHFAESMTQQVTSLTTRPVLVVPADCDHAADPLLDGLVGPAA